MVNSVRGPNGYSSEKRGFDSVGNLIQQYYFGFYNQPVQNNGSFQTEGTFDGQGNKTMYRYLNLFGKAALNSSGFSMVEFKYDGMNYLRRAAYLNEKGFPWWGLKVFQVALFCMRMVGI